MVMEEEPAAEQAAAALTEALPSAEEVAAGVEESGLPAEVRVATNLILLRVNEQTDGVLTLVPQLVASDHRHGTHWRAGARSAANQR